MRTAKALCKPCGQAVSETKSRTFSPHDCPVCGLLVVFTLDDYEVAVVRFHHARGYCQMPAQDYREYKTKQSEEKCR